MEEFAKLVTNGKKKTPIFIIDDQRYRDNPVNSEIDIEELLTEKYGKENIAKLREEKEKLAEKAVYMKELYKTHKDLTEFSVLDKEDFYDYEE